MIKSEKIQIGIVLLFAIAAFFVVYWALTPIKNFDFNLKKMNDSLVHELSVKDSLLEIKEAKYIEESKKDSIKLQSIHQSINNLFHEINKQTRQNYFIPDSMYQFYIDSIRTNKGFYKIQH